MSPVNFSSDIRVGTGKDGLLYGLIQFTKLNTAKKERILVKLVRGKRTDLLVDAKSNKALAISLRERNVRDYMHLEDVVYAELLKHGQQHHLL